MKNQYTQALFYDSVYSFLTSLLFPKIIPFPIYAFFNLRPLFHESKQRAKQDFGAYVTTASLFI
jgi:hypothetical protein